LCGKIEGWAFDICVQVKYLAGKLNPVARELAPARLRSSRKCHIACCI